MISGNHCDRSSMSLQSFPELFTIISPSPCNNFFNTPFLFPKWPCQRGKSTLKTVIFHQNDQNPCSFSKCYFVRYLLRVSFIFTLIFWNHRNEISFKKANNHYSCHIVYPKLHENTNNLHFMYFVPKYRILIRVEMTEW